MRNVQTADARRRPLRFSDIDDAGDDLVLSETFAATAYTLNADHSDGTNDAWCRAGNLIDDGQMRYTYDAWNRLVKVTRKRGSSPPRQCAGFPPARE